MTDNESASAPSTGFIAPCLPTMVKSPPEGAEWIHEVKQDGYRTIVAVQAGRARAFTRTGIDWTRRYGPICETAAGLPCRSAILDGEAVVLDERGASDFHALASVIARQPERVVLIGFDLLHLDGLDLRGARLDERRDALETLIRDAPSQIQFSQAFEGRGPEFFASVEAMGLEGVVSKRVDSAYRSGPSRNWLKAKCWTESVLDVIGIGKTSKGEPIALLSSDGAYCGAAVITLGKNERSAFYSAAEDLLQEHAPLAAAAGKEKRWLRSGLKARVRHLKGERKLRHAVLLGFVLA